MKTDRELLELAAKAAGLRHAGYVEGRGLCIPWYEGADDLDTSWWNPLLDNGIAFGLAVKAGMTVHFHEATVVEFFVDGETAKELSDDCPRRAIVLAAASIGERHDA